MKIRSILFNICFYTHVFWFYVLCFPILYLIPKSWTHISVQYWARGVIFLLWIFGIKTEIRGHENKPKKGGYIVAAKHQSEWDTQVNGYDLDMAIFVVKKELFKQPFFGWILKKVGMIGVDRSGKRGVMRQMLDQAIPLLQQGRVLVIYPEGTRKEPGAEPDYKPGIAMMYKHANVPVVPVALNSGLFWRKNKLLRKGKAIMEYLPVIEPGLDTNEFMKKLEESIESATKRLIEEQS